MLCNFVSAVKLEKAPPKKTLPSVKNNIFFLIFINFAMFAVLTVSVDCYSWKRPMLQRHFAALKLHWVSLLEHVPPSSFWRLLVQPWLSVLLLGHQSPRRHADARLLSFPEKQRCGILSVYLQRWGIGKSSPEPSRLTRLPGCVPLTRWQPTTYFVRQ